MFRLIKLISFCLLAFSGILAAPGDLDISFNGSGLVTTEIANSARAYDVAIQNNGKILAAGTRVDVSTGTNFDFTALRYNEDGSIDTGFANNGRFISATSTSDDIASAVLIQRDGKILLGGYSIDTDINKSRLTLVRINPDGSADTSFGVNGIVRVAPASPVGLAIADFPIRKVELSETKNGAIILGGTVFLEGSLDATQSAVFRFKNNGSLDPDFGDGGISRLFPAAECSFRDLIETHNSKIYVLCQAQSISVSTAYLALLKKDGELDSMGYKAVSQDPRASLFDLALQEDQKLLIAGHFNDAGPQDFYLLLYRFEQNLEPDTDFGINNDGEARLIIFGRDLHADIEIQRDGKILLLASTFNQFNNTSDFSLVRLNRDGSFDLSVGPEQNGVVLTDFFVNSAFSRDNAAALSIHRGKAVAVGDIFPSLGRRSFGVARYLLR